jgi:hypothetical protein
MKQHLEGTLVPLEVVWKLPEAFRDRRQRWCLTEIFYSGIDGADKLGDIHRCCGVSLVVIAGFGYQRERKVG